MKIVNVNWAGDFKLELEFSDGFKGIADLSEIPAIDLNHWVKDFKHFSLEEYGCLKWDSFRVQASTLRQMAEGDYCKPSVINSNDMESVLKQAIWDSMVENRPDVFRAALFSFVGKDSIQMEDKNDFNSLVELGHAAWIQREQDNLKE